MRHIVDPAEGWAYGFPAVWDKEKHPDITDLFKEKKYPERYWNFPVRMWYEDDNREQG